MTNATCEGTERRGRRGGGHTLGCWSLFPLGGLLVFIQPCLVTLPRDRVFLPSLSSCPLLLSFLLGSSGQSGQCWLWVAQGVVA